MYRAEFWLNEGQAMGHNMSQQFKTIGTGRIRVQEVRLVEDRHRGDGIISGGSRLTTYRAYSRHPFVVVVTPFMDQETKMSLMGPTFFVFPAAERLDDGTFTHVLVDSLSKREELEQLLTYHRPEVQKDLEVFLEKSLYE